MNPKTTLRDPFPTKASNRRTSKIAVIVGYGAYTSWELFSREQLALDFASSAIPLWGPIFLTSAIAFALVFLFAANRMLRTTFGTGAAATVFLALMTVLLFLATGGLQGNVMLAFLGMMLTGASIAWFLNCWIQHLAHLSCTQLFAFMSASEVFASTILLIQTQVPSLASTFCAASSLAVSIACLLFLERRKPSESNVVDTEAKSASRSIESPRPNEALVALAISLFLFGAFAIAVRTVISQEVGTSHESLVLVSLGASILLAFAACFSYTTKQGIRRTLGACLIVLLVAIAICAALDLEAHLVFLGCIRFGFTFVIAVISYLARTSQLNTLITASCVWACSYLGYSAGGFVGTIFSDAPIDLGSTLILCSLVVVGLLALIATLIGPASKALPKLADRIAHLFSLPEAETSRQAKTIDNATSAHTDIASTAEMVAADFNLSKRETDVFVLLAQGRDTNYIAQTLFISANTTKMHRRNIYRKMEVHSQQDIIDLVLKAAADLL